MTKDDLMTKDERLFLQKCQKRAQMLFKEGSYQGDIAREPVEALHETDRVALEAINETLHALTCRGLDASEVLGVA